MAAIMNPPMPSWPSAQPTHNMGWGDPHLQYTQQPMMTTAYMQPVRPLSMPTGHTHREQLPRPSQSGPWTADEDAVLVEERGRGLAWDDIHNRHFPNKSGNACRKRHERLLAKARDSDWSEERIHTVLVIYNRHREELWKTVAEQVGEKWEDVEKVMFQQGLRNLRAAIRPGRHARTRSRTSSNPANFGEYEQPSSQDELEHADDSGISLGHGGHSRRTSELGTMVQQTSLPSVDRILAEPHKLGFMHPDTDAGNGYHPDPRGGSGYTYSH